MSDLCAPIYVVTGADEVMTFWCFASVMERMVSPLASIDRCADDGSQKQNFLRDQSGMKKQLATLQQLLAVMDPVLYRHLGTLNTRTSERGRIKYWATNPWIITEKTDSLNLFFCFRYEFTLPVLVIC